MLSFKAHSHPYYKKGFWWYLAASAVCLIILAVFVYLKLYLGAVALALLAVVWFVYSRKPQEEKKCEISEKGVLFGEKFFSKNQLKSFSFMDNEDISVLYLETAIRFRPLIHIFMIDGPIKKIRKILIKYLPEKKHEEDFADKRLRWLKV